MTKDKNPSCKCTYPCPRHGDCKACIEYHVKTGSSTNCGKRELPKEK